MSTKKRHPLLDKLYQGKTFNLLDYAGNLKYEICYQVSWELFAEKNPGTQAARAKAVVETMRANGQDAWAAELVNRYFPRFNINYTE